MKCANCGREYNECNGRCVDTNGTRNVPKIGDSSDKVIELSKGTRLHGATVEEWIVLIHKNPDRTLPGGVGGAIVAYYGRVIDDYGRVVLELQNPSYVSERLPVALWPDAYDPRAKPRRRP